MNLFRAAIRARPRRAAIATFLAMACMPAVQAATAPQVEPWVPAGVSSDRFESHPAFDPRNGDFYFVRSSPAFQGWRILVSRCGADGWTPPLPAAFSGDGVEADPWFAGDGNTLYFISTRTSDGIKRKDLDIWRVQRDGDGRWGMPERLPAPVNSTGNEWFPRLDRDGWLYFGSDRAGGLGKTDIWRARRGQDGRWRVENAGKALNTAGDEYEPLPSPDGRSLVMMAADGLYLARRDDPRAAWRPREKLPSPINVNGSEIGALFSPSGHSLLFARDLKGDRSGEFFVWRLRGREAWPPACPATAANGTGKAGASGHGR
ncbi:TolB family protein [Luteimonas aquatica]|uniref:TolB family protein n=1 Tax=Luteimonas aquatica TaxID=450364 RepID=UPI001F58F967|nr:hypothetical protein [Luteimonas aquatica]